MTKTTAANLQMPARTYAKFGSENFAPIFTNYNVWCFEFGSLGFV